MLTLEEQEMVLAFGVTGSVPLIGLMFRVAKEYILDKAGIEVESINHNKLINLIAINNNLVKIDFYNILQNIINKCDLAKYEILNMSRQFLEIELLCDIKEDHRIMPNVLLLIKSGVTIIGQNRRIQQYINSALLYETKEIYQDNITAYLAKTRGQFTKSASLSSIGKPISDTNTQD